MTISLSPQTQRLLEERLKAGSYQSADAVVHAALEALAEREQFGLDEQTLDTIDRAENQIERGEYRAWSDVREQVRSMFLKN